MLSSCVLPGLVPQSFETIEGRRENTLIYVCNDYGYVKNVGRLVGKPQVETLFLRCWFTKQHCGGSAKIVYDDQGEALFFELARHCHPPVPEEIAVTRLKAVIKQKACASSTGSLKKIFDEETNESPVGHLISYKEICSSMTKRRKKFYDFLEVSKQLRLPKKKLLVPKRRPSVIRGQLGPIQCFDPVVMNSTEIVKLFKEDEHFETLI